MTNTPQLPAEFIDCRQTKPLLPNATLLDTIGVTGEIYYGGRFDECFWPNVVAYKVCADQGVEAPTLQVPLSAENLAPGFPEAADRLGDPLFDVEAPALPAGHVSGDFTAPTLENDEPRTCAVKGCGKAKSKHSKWCVVHSAPDGGPAPAPLSRSNLQFHLDVNKWANFAAIDSDGRARLFSEQPIRHANDKWGALGEQMTIGGTFDTNEWETMLYPTSHPVPQPATAADLAPGFPEDEDQHGWADELEEAKDRARALLEAYNADGTRNALELVQYMAIFGEQP